MKKVDIIKLAQWLIATVAVSTSTCFTAIRFVYSDFDTQRTNDVYRQQLDKRLDEINAEILELSRKVDKILLLRK
jgi:hypothetical protein